MERIRAHCSCRPYRLRWLAFGRFASASLPASTEVNEWVLAVAGLLGLEEVHAAGGTQAMGAMAFGTESIAPVNKIVGPGNDYVIAAKLEVFGVVGIDAPQGPSDVVVIADSSAFPERVASDLMAQAEHLSGASSVLLSPSELVEAVEPLLSGEPAEHISLVRVRDLAQAVEISNHYAPEHAHVISEDWEAVMNDLGRSAWSVSVTSAPLRSATTPQDLPTPCLPAERRPGPRPETHDFVARPTTCTSPSKPSKTSPPMSNGLPVWKASKTTPKAWRPDGIGQRSAVSERS